MNVKTSVELDFLGTGLTSCGYENHKTRGRRFSVLRRKCVVWSGLTLEVFGQKKEPHGFRIVPVPNGLGPQCDFLLRHPKLSNRVAALFSGIYYTIFAGIWLLQNSRDLSR